MESGAITDGQITASSQYNGNHAAAQGRLHFNTTAGKAGAWVVATRDNNQWLQIDLGSNNFTVTRVATQGRNGHVNLQAVTKYNLQYSDDEVNFQYYKEQGQTKSKVKKTSPKCCMDKSNWLFPKRYFTFSMEIPRFKLFIAAKFPTIFLFKHLIHSSPPIFPIFPIYFIGSYKTPIIGQNSYISYKYNVLLK